MKALLFALVAAVCMAPVNAGSIPDGDYGSSIPLLVPRNDGGGFVLIDRRHYPGFMGQDTAYETFQYARKINPGLAEQFWSNIVVPRLVRHQGSDSFVNHADLRRGGDIVRRQFTKELRGYLDALEAGSSERFVAPWYSPILDTAPVDTRDYVCGPCDLGAKPSKYCNDVQCVDCSEEAGTLCEITDVDLPDADNPDETQTPQQWAPR